MTGQSVTQLLSPSHIGDVNRSRVLQALCDHGPMSRADLAKIAGVTRATIGNIVQALIDAGLVEEGEPRTGLGRVGKPGRPVWFGPRAGLSGAVAVGPESVEAALVNARGDVLERWLQPIDGGRDGAVAIAAAVADGVRKVLPRRSSDVLGVGVAVPGVCEPRTGMVIGSGQLPGLAGFALGAEVSRSAGVRVLVDNDSRAQALGEKWFGEGKGSATFASVQTGHGLGAGLVVDGVLLRGRGGQTGELGHTCVDPAGATCRCGLVGCWETIATLRWLRSEGRRRGVRGGRSLDAAKLVAAVGGGSGSEAAAGLLRDYATNLAVGIANLVQVLSPELVIVHGDAVGGGETLRALIEAAVRERVLPHLRGTVRVVLSRLDQQATLVGAAGLVLSHTFDLAA